MVSPLSSAVVRGCRLPEQVLVSRRATKAVSAPTQSGRRPHAAPFSCRAAVSARQLAGSADLNSLVQPGHPALEVQFPDAFGLAPEPLGGLVSLFAYSVLPVLAPEAHPTVFSARKAQMFLPAGKFLPRLGRLECR